jgi:hypothetical protein
MGQMGAWNGETWLFLSLRKFGALFGEEYKSETEKLYGDLRKLIHGEDTV